jgi:hypothetical protein
MSEDFARHWVGNHCELSDAAAGALLGNRQMREIRALDSDAAKEAIKRGLAPN